MENKNTIKTESIADCDTDGSRMFLSNLLHLKEKLVLEMVAHNNFKSKAYEILLATIVMYIEKEYQF